MIAAARSAFAEAGVENFSMRVVAERAGITAGAIYRHFPGREQLIEAVVADAFKELELRLLRAVSSLPVGSYDRVRELGRQYIRLALANPDHFNVLFSPKFSETRKIGDLPGAAGFELLVQCIHECMEAGVLRPAEPQKIALMLWTRVHGIIALFSALDVGDSFPQYSGPDGALLFFEDTHDLVLNGLAGSRP